MPSDLLNRCPRYRTQLSHLGRSPTAIYWDSAMASVSVTLSRRPVAFNCSISALESGRKRECKSLIVELRVELQITVS